MKISHWSLVIGSLVIGLLAIVSSACTQASPASAPSIALDHVVFATNDLDATAQRFRSFGFTLKLGRPHDNGIRNQHVKFADGTELELLTAPEARDELTTKYRQHLAEGDGPAYLALMVRGEPAPAEKPSYIFFGSRNASPTDLPVHFEHANTAHSLIAVWLSRRDFKAEKTLLARYNAKDRERRSMIGHVAQVVELAEGGALYLLPHAAGPIADRPIVGVTLAIRSISTAENALRQAGVVYATDYQRGSILLTPPETGGLWIELTVRQ